MVWPRGTPSTGRHRIEISLRQDKSSRQVTFSKRRVGIFKKCSELSILCGARVAFVVFSEAGNVFALSSPSMEAILPGFPAAADGAVVDGDDREVLEEMCRAKEATAEQVAAEIERMNSIGDKVVKAQMGKRFWWEADVEALGEAELPEFVRALERLRANVCRHADKKLISVPPPAVVAEAPGITAADAHGDALF